MASWEAGLKTTYYLRNRGASKVEKSNESSESAEENKEELDAEVSLEESAACSILDPGCESCQ